EFRVSAGMELYVMGSDGRNRRQLTQNEVYDSAPHWSPEGTKIAFASRRTGNYEIHIMDANGENERQLTFSQK
ncbi:hypothetical protein GWO43_07870, partial [candidate division KSB1 bacterium]|nr:hypothetical protein [candidate division KSB1 bacterium]NIS23886.1 hypothetical protein [candidate division KSB1 bacterium]NIT70803.1 hypothetical protein [candidate division KSB1 bacterium]NIU24535.1 hypothetical protein [candidate division KSB1 bacterium]NIU94489.1 hypothetical protein [candidate division KSB1 bacterium]